MEPRIETLTIERFRALRNLTISGLGRVNLITGLNNSGKSSLLEAVRILASGFSPHVVREILRFREEDSDEVNDTLTLFEQFPFSSLFHGFPHDLMNLQPIVIASQNVGSKLYLSINVEWFSEQTDSDGQIKLVPPQKGLFAEGEVVPMIVINRGDTTHRFSFDYFTKRPYRNRPRSKDFTNGESFACEFVSPYCGARTGTLGALWDKIALTDEEEHVFEALRIIDENIMAVSMVAGERYKESRTAIVRAVNLPHPVPLRTFGDGLNRLFGIILSLVNAKNGLLLIDEFENGLHHSVQENIWRTIFKISKRLDIQVMATSHSWDSIEAFQKVACEESEDGVLVRLSRKGEDIIPTVFTEDELAIATRDRIEVR